jgi:hypothetical protein
MFYKKINGDWYKGLNINLPSGIVLSPQNKQDIEGWEWYDEEPIEYTMDSHKEGFSLAMVERQTPTEVLDITSLIVSLEVLENRLNKTFSVPIYLDDEYYYLENLNKSGILTENEITEKVISYLQNI